MIPITRRSCYSLRRTLSGLDLPHLTSGGYIDTRRRPPLPPTPDRYLDNGPPALTLPPPHSLSICTTGGGQYLTLLYSMSISFMSRASSSWKLRTTPTGKSRKLK